jgi:hypothetical protein
VKEPLRLLNDADTPISMRQALSAAEDVPPLPPTIRAAISDVAAKLSITATTGTAIGTKSTLVLLESLGLKAASKALVVVACLGAASGVAYVVEPLVVGRVSSRKPVSTVAQPAVKFASQPAEAVSLSPTLPVSEPAPQQRPARVPRVAELRPSVAAEDTNEPPVLESKIAREAKLLERARSHLASDPELALRETNLHRERFGEGQMSAERELIAVEALLRLGRRAEAEGRAAPRLQQDPTGLYAKRLRQVFTEF